MIYSNLIKASISGDIILSTGIGEAKELCNLI